jgi:hypothetical protein
VWRTLIYDQSKRVTLTEIDMQPATKFGMDSDSNNSINFLDLSIPREEKVRIYNIQKAHAVKT